MDSPKNQTLVLRRQGPYQTSEVFRDLRGPAILNMENVV